VRRITLEQKNGPSSQTARVVGLQAVLGVEVDAMSCGQTLISFG